MVDCAGFDFVGSSGPPTPAAAIGMISAVFDFDATCNAWPLRAAAVDVAHYVPFVDIRGPFDGKSEQPLDS